MMSFRGFSIFSRLAAAAAIALGLAACQTSSGTKEESGQATKYIDPGTGSKVSGVGIESQDIVSMTDEMMRDMMSYPVLASRQTPPRVMLDSQYFVNESAQRINLSLIVNRLRTGLFRASRGRMEFISQEAAGLVAKQRDLKRSGTTDVGTTGLTRAQAGVDYVLKGTIASQDKVTQDGYQERYVNINFEMVDAETGQLVWINQYEFAKGGKNDVVYQ